MDIRTLLFADLVLQICCSLGMGLMSRNIAGLRGLRWFAWAYGCITGALIVVVAGPAGPLLNRFLVTGHILALLGAVLLQQGVAEFATHRRRGLRWPLAGLLAFAVFDLGLSSAHLFAALRLAAFNCLFAAAILSAAFELARRCQYAERSASRATAVMLTGIAALFLLRTVRVSIPGATLNFLSPDPLRFAGLVGYMILNAGTAFGFVWMITARLRQQLENQARTDALTGVLNRRALELGVEREIAACRRRDSTVAVVAMDIDHFKGMNDSFGHAGGDAALCAVARLMTQSLRRADLVARYGGEEFVAVLPDMDTNAALEIAERLRRQVEALGVQFDREVLRFTASFGVAALSGPDDTWSALLERADRALYAAKQAGRNLALSGPADAATTPPHAALGLLG